MIRKPPYNQKNNNTANTTTIALVIPPSKQIQFESNSDKIIINSFEICFKYFLELLFSNIEQYS